MTRLAMALVAVLMLTAQAAPVHDEVTSLPGLDFKPAFKQYSGYLNATASKRLHYWFVEAENDPANAPVLLWLNGGPGCSSLDGFLSEHGPFHLRPDGKTLYKNPYAWNQVANVVYLEAPAGVGFSYSTNPEDYNTDDDKTSEDNYQALLHFFAKFPEFAANEFFVTGESYGGVYVPTLATRIQAGNKAGRNARINLVGIATGNGYSSVKDLTNSLVFFAYYHGLIDLDAWRGLGEACCTSAGIYPEQGACDFTTTSGQCASLVSSAMEVVYNGRINWYALYLPCDNTKPNERMIRAASLVAKRFNLTIKPSPPATGSRSLLGNVPCINTGALDTWLNTEAVKKALHVDTHLSQPWSICSNVLNYTQQYDNAIDLYPTLLENYRALVYNGDTDMACNFLGDQWAVEGLQLKVVSPYREWFTDGQVAGFVKTFDGSLDLLTVKGAGHMVPQWKPPQALHMITAFLRDEPY